ncbi:hypothetical protein GQ607_007073 [Colletotrichum asianum]|uniref:Uncharacterized protein n=1 Tax=Colletotrichum asianum TaxID=702518 RepID=A0A8H3ZTE2_9PEZI|nr:hypothetical protein GQ607_007073 [Colletotrichum asianum]
MHNLVAEWEWPQIPIILSPFLPTARGTLTYRPNHSSPQQHRQIEAHLGLSKDEISLSGCWWSCLVMNLQQTAPFLQVFVGEQCPNQQPEALHHRTTQYTISLSHYVPRGIHVRSSTSQTLPLRPSPSIQVERSCGDIPQVVLSTPINRQSNEPQPTNPPNSLRSNP